MSKRTLLSEAPVLTLHVRDIKGSHTYDGVLAKLALLHEKEQEATRALFEHHDVDDTSHGESRFERLTHSAHGKTLERQKCAKKKVDDGIKQLIGKGNLAQQVQVMTYSGERRALALELTDTLRDVDTKVPEFRQTMVRLYGHLFEGIYHNYSVELGLAKTPVTFPRQQFVVRHQYTPHDWSKSVVCVLLRDGLLPSLALGKKIREELRTSPEYALFHVGQSGDTVDTLKFMLYRSQTYYNPQQLEGKDLIFPAPTLATAGSLILVYRALVERNIKPRSVTYVGAISSMEGIINAVENIPGIRIYTAAIDPALNDRGDILPGFGNVGDRLGCAEKNGKMVLRFMESCDGIYQRKYKNEVEAVERAMRQ